MENNKAYLRQFGIAFLIAALSAVVTIWLSDSYSRNFSRSSILILLLQSIPVILLLINTGIVTELWKAAVGSIAVFVTMAVLKHFLLGQNKDSAIGQGAIIAIHQVSYLLTFFVFFLLAKAESKKLPVIALGLLLLFGTSTLYQSTEGFEWIGKAIGTKINLPRYLLVSIASVTSHLIQLLILCELLNYAKGKTIGFKPRIINPGNEYSKLNGTIIFWILKTFLYLSVLGALGMMLNYVDFFGRYYNESYSYLKWYYLFNLLMTGAAIIAAAWYLRKFLLEYFISYHFSSRFLYWFFLLPIVGIFAWLAMLADSDKKEGFTQRKKGVEDFASSSPNGVIGLFLVLLILRFLISLINGGAQPIITILITGLLFFALISSITGYYINLYLSFAVLLTCIILPFFISTASTIMVLIPLLLLNIAQLILIYPVLHFSAFDYISYEEEEKPWEPGQDLF
jgi:hypothetical protein